jgi:hypothetical protein
MGHGADGKGKARGPMVGLCAFPLIEQKTLDGWGTVHFLSHEQKALDGWDQSIFFGIAKQRV